MSTRAWGCSVTGRGVCLLLLSGSLGPACVQAEAPTAEQAERGAAEPTPATAPVAEPSTVAEIFPDGEGKDLVLNNCGSCHAVACNAIGQRTAARWDALRDDHGDKASGLSEDDLDTVFSYLSAHFDDSTPEPRVPEAFLAEGCTPF